MQAHLAKGKTLLSEETATTTLLPPMDKFYHKTLYEAMFGDPKSEKNKKLKHRVITLHGHEGVAVPGDTNQDVPWDIQRAFGSGLKKSDIVDNIEAGEEEDFKDQLQRKFDEMKAIDSDEYAKACSGASFSELMNMVKQKTEQEEAAAKVAKEKAAATMQPAEVASSSAGQAQEQPPLLTDNESSSDDGGILLSRRALVVLTSDEKTPPGPARSKVLTRFAKRSPKLGGGIVAKPNKKATGGGNNATGGTTSKAAGKAKAVALAGKPTMSKAKHNTNLTEYSEKLILEFFAATKDSVFFNEATKLAQTRSIIRYIGLVRTKMVDQKEGSPDFAESSLNLKRLQVSVCVPLVSFCFLAKTGPIGP